MCDRGTGFQKQGLPYTELWCEVFTRDMATSNYTPRNIHRFMAEHYFNLPLFRQSGNSGTGDTSLSSASLFLLYAAQIYLRVV
jgi:hypothetical protein